MGVGEIACTDIQIIQDSVIENEESFEIALQTNDLVLAVSPDTATVVIGELTFCKCYRNDIQLVSVRILCSFILGVVKKLPD